MRPEERLPTKRTASSGSRVPPALTSTRFGKRPVPRAGASSTARKISSGSDIRPTPRAPLGSLAFVGADQLDAALAQRRPAFAWVAG